MSSLPRDYAVAGPGGNHRKAMTSPTLRVILASSLGAISTCTAAFAQADYPPRSIKLIVPFAAGGGVDKKFLRSLLPQFPGARMLEPCDPWFLSTGVRCRCPSTRPRSYRADPATASKSSRRSDACSGRG